MVIWLIFLILGLVVMILGYPRMKVLREPDREGMDDRESVEAYDHVSRWFIFRLKRKMILSALKKYHLKGTLVDIGCGPGYLPALIGRKFPHVKVIGLDMSDEMIRLAKQNWASSLYSNLDFWNGDVNQLPLRDDIVDFVVSSLSLHHWLDPKKSLQEIHRILRPGGQFLFFDLRRDSRRLFYYILKFSQAFIAPSAIQRTNGAVGSFWSSYTPTELIALLSETPFQQWRIRPQFGWMFAWGRKGWMK